jgi:PAS domain S-box-containing protein
MDPRGAPWRNGALQRGFRSGVGLPLKDEHANTFGCLSIYSAQPNAFTSEEIRLLEELAGDMAFGIVNLRSRAEHKRTEEALRRSESYLAEAQRLSHTGSWALDVASGNYVYFSEEYSRISGFDPQQGLPAKDQPLQQIHPDDVDKFWQAYQKVIEEKVDSEGEYRIVLPDGTVKYVHAIRHPVLNANGELVEVVGTTIDITERKRGEEALRHSEAYLAEAERLSHTGSWAFDVASNKYLYISEECFRMFELDPQDGLPTREAVSRLIHREDWDEVRASFDKTLREKANTSTEFRIALPSGKVKHIQATRHPVLDEAGEIIQIVGTAMDITERKRAEEALREGETRFRTFVDHAGDALFVYDLERRTIIDVNRSACEGLGYTREELIGKTSAAIHVDTELTEIESVGERAAAGETVFDRHWHRRKDGSTFPVEVHTSMISYGGRRFLLKVARDISDRVRAEEQRDKLRQLETELAHLDRLTMLGELTASIAHEVNQPLSGVVSNGSACLRWLEGDSPNLEEAREAARRIVRDGKRAGEVIARIRALTKKASTPREKLDLNETFRQVLTLIADQAKRNSVVIRTQFADDLSPISGDQVQLQQVVLNLAMNAIEAMSNVSERVRELVITTRNIDTDQVQVTVEDSGVGLDPSSMQKIFEPFYTTKPTGMGMGLSISRSILQSHGGRLWAAAKDGPGTIFYFTLPKYHEEEFHAGVSAA